jgi:hypothetical protein
MALIALGTGCAAANGDAHQVPAQVPEAPVPVAVAPVAVARTPATAAAPKCIRIRGAQACVGPDESNLPGITVQDTAADKYHPAVEYYLNGYLGTLYVIHNLGHKGETKGSREIGKTVTFRAAVYKGGHRVIVSRWKTVQNLAKYPVKRETNVTPAAARARSSVCTVTRAAASFCFGERKSTVVFACDTSADERQARAEYFVGGDPTARFEIHQLAGADTCGKAEHGDLAVSMYRASVYNQNHRVATRLYKYH